MGKQGYDDYAGFAWYRLNLTFLSFELPLDQLSVTIGKVHSAYELYIGGELVGGVGSLPPSPQIRYDQHKTYRIPSEAINAQGHLTLAIRVWRSTVIDHSWEGGLYEPPLLLGISNQLNRGILQRLHTSLFLVILYLLIGFYHIFLYWRGKGLDEYLWFGLLTIAISVYAFMTSQLQHATQFDYALLKKIEFSVLYITPALALEFFWRILSVRPKHIFRLYQFSFSVFALIIIVIPGFLVNFKTLSLWHIWVLPAIFGIANMLVRHSWKGHFEARTILVGSFIFAGTILNDIASDNGILNTLKLGPIGFTALIFSLTVSLANRITWIFSNLEQKVAERTKELQEANKKLEQTAHVDFLTQIFNRRAFLERAKSEVARFRRTGKTFSIVLLDIDEFKKLNDTYGHACGDYVLKEVTKVLSSSLREMDIVARWGGEEFIILLAETKLNTTSIVIERICTLISNKNYHFEGKSFHISMTFGISELQDGMVLDECVSNADQALYKGKKAGKNRVVVYEVSSVAKESN